MYSREIDGELLSLAASGWTYDDTFVLYDKQTFSMWYHLAGSDGITCIAGVYQDRILPELTSTLTRWSEWLNQHPQSHYLKTQ